MAWLWNTWEEYVEQVQPVVAASRGGFRHAMHATYFEAESELHENFQALQSTLSSLRQLGFDKWDPDRPAGEKATLDEAHGLVSGLVYAGEKLLLYHKRLATSDDAYGFLSQHDILDHWDRYYGPRLFGEIDQLITDTTELVDGFYRLKKEDEKFLIYDLDLPEDLKADFRVARNLFSIGAEEVGLFMTGRGLEAVLRHIAKARKIIIAGRLRPNLHTKQVWLISSRRWLDCDGSDRVSDYSQSKLKRCSIFFEPNAIATHTRCFKQRRQWWHPES